jgi:Domain of unknown function (DUF4386)
VAHEAQLEWERRAARPAAAAAFASAVFLVAGTIVRQAVALQSRPDNEAEFLVAVEQESTSFLISGILQSLNFLALGVVLWFLYRVTRYRRPALPGWGIYLVYVGPTLLAAAGVFSDLDRIGIADDFTASGERTEKRAEDLLEDRSVFGVALGSAGTLALAFSLVLISLNAMRAGVMSRFLGILGIIVGALSVLPLFGGPLIIQVFWLGALGAVFLGYWPRGRGPAWESGEPDPWPTQAERWQSRQGEAQPEPEAGAEDAETAHPVSRKRKRKRRQ